MLVVFFDCAGDAYRVADWWVANVAVQDDERDVGAGL